MGNRYVIKDKLLSFSGDLTIDDEQGRRAFRCDGKVIRIGRKVELQDLEGNELYTVQHKLMHLHSTFDITRAGNKVATVRKAIVTLHPKFAIERAGGDDLEVKGNLVEHDYTIHENGSLVATVHNSWVTVRDAYGVEVESGYEEPFVLACVLAVDMAIDIEHEAVT
jgi:uncharacterized protein YxjI